jgi:hypothetical protein
VAVVWSHNAGRGVFLMFKPSAVLLFLVVELYASLKSVLRVIESVNKRVEALLLFCGV